MIVTLFGNGLGPSAGVQGTASLTGPFPEELAGVRVTFDGKPGPVLYVQDGQINAMAPWSLTPGQTTNVCAIYNSSETNCLSVKVLPASPSVFMVDEGYAAAVNQDGTINSASNPAKRGTYVSIFATGLGPISPAQGDGTLIGLPLPINVFPAGVTEWVNDLWGQHFQSDVVHYAGPAPFQVAGVSQVNYIAGGLSTAVTVIPPGGRVAASNAFWVYVSPE